MSDEAPANPAWVALARRMPARPDTRASIVSACFATILSDLTSGDM